MKILSLPRSGGLICTHETQQRLYDRVQDVKLNYVVQKRKKKNAVLGCFFRDRSHFQVVSLSIAGVASPHFVYGNVSLRVTFRSTLSRAPGEKKKERRLK